MKCKNCGSLIPDQSVFCPYCGVSSAEMNYQPAPQPQSAVSYSAPMMPQSPIPASRKEKAKERKCPKCGNLLSKKQKACPACGEAVPADPKKAKTAIISMSVAICLLLCSTVYFMLEMFKGNQAIDELRTEVASYSELIEKLNSELSAQTRRADSWSKDYRDLKEEYDRISRKADFYERYAVIIGNSNYYHSYDCSYLDKHTVSYIFNKENARYQGFRPCPYCQ